MSGDPVKEKRSSRRVEPVAEHAPSETSREEGGGARRVLAVWLALGPLASVAGFLGWLRLLTGLRVEPLSDFSFAAITLDALLALQFALSHSLLARGFGRRLLNRPFGPAAERPLYVLVTGASLCLMVLAWQPSGPLLWEWPGWWRAIPWFVQACGIGLIAWGCLVVGNTMLLGLPQLRAIEAGQQEPQAEFTALPPYAYVRQPINAGFILLLVGIPVMSVDLLIMALVFLSWILLAAPFEERDLEIEFDGYTSYRERTPRWYPRLRGRDR
ncbi:MAG: hypothetical protein O3A20_10100 [Planctomycetota bacterium]|nr:hypothetical protein [Planctomycetota bacterium]